MKRYILTIVTGVVSAAAGAAVGHFLARKKLEAEYDSRLEAEVAVTVAHLNDKYKGYILNRRVPGENLDPITAAETEEEKEAKAYDLAPHEVLEKAVRKLRYSPNVPVGDPKPLQQRNAFDEDDEPDEDEEASWAAEVAARSSKHPFLITAAEYAEDDQFSKTSLTYFLMDDVLVDENEMPIENTDRIVGDVNLSRFGYRSGDPRIVFVRNLKLTADYEILRHEGYFSETVHGIIPNPKDRPRKMRKE